MLYCPKCQTTYEDGTQRFCTNEGIRLLPVSSSKKSPEQPIGVFSSILGKNLKTNIGEKFESTEPETASEKTGQSKFSAFQPPGESKFFNEQKKADPLELDLISDKENVPADSVEKTKPFEALPLAHIIDPGNIPERYSRFDELFSEDTPKTSDETETSEIFEPFDILEPFEDESNIGSSPTESAAIAEPIAFEADFQNQPDKQVENVSSGSEEPELNLDEFDLLGDDLVETPAAQEPLAEAADEPIDFSGFDLELGNEDFEEITVEDEKSLGAGEDFQLDLTEPGAPLAADQVRPEFELEMDEIGETPVSAVPISTLELDLEDSKEVIDQPAAALPQLELELDGFDAVEAKEPEKAQLKSDSKEFDSDQPIPEPVDFQTGLEKKASPAKADEVEEITEPKKIPTMVTAPTDLTGIKATSDLAWEKRSEDPAATMNSNWYLPVIIGLIILVLGAFGLAYLMNPKKAVETQPANSASNFNPQNVSVGDNNVNQPINEQPIEQPIEQQPYQQPEENAPISIDSPPSPRPVKQPPNTVFYKNKKNDQKGELARQFLGFSVFYPKGWKENKADNKFLDISRSTPDGFPIKQFLVSRYDSRGTYSEDLELFDQLVERSNNDLKAILTNYQVISKGETTIQNGRWKAYEVKFQGLVSSKQLILWGRRIWIPVQRKGMKSGFIITMIATSLADDIKSVEDIGVKGDFATILNTFEPDLE